MKATETKLKGCFILEPSKFGDSRGYFFESFNAKTFNNLIGAEVNFVQDNQSFSSFGVLRGLHAQAGEHAQAKLVRVIQGKVLDVAVDVRPGSETYGQYVAVELSEENNLQLFIPRGFLHGFSVFSEKATFFYKCDNNYNKDSENGVNPLDLDLKIDWGIPHEKMVISDKDINAQIFEAFKRKNNQ
ncbi:dTDP-4-dehydrorhamnose 3,5-epimerase [Chryseobacterium sp. Leaf404]|uniref:dTDP-4-dehydrorhamnose 3,5-epimerase n=1 Tax=unclassified Chryseobacterium TaxID=2593645 RepID=UPI0006F29010|nr:MULTISPECIES: dTDP-4-dehydrorhamnose 3,5-epimerase [unclassified Chryseobacterium]KQT17868.1 dTDP-4-dehydrorhamnose 3,5-epimerase [Chryseobacterium sp. Leaf404]